MMLILIPIILNLMVHFTFNADDGTNGYELWEA